MTGCGVEDPAPLAGANVLLITVDTLGAKHLGAWGAPDGPSPRIDRLAAEGVRFETSRSTAPWTQPSVASIFTSRMPSRHGVTNLLDSLPGREQTLAEHLTAAGYSSHAVISHFLIGSEFGFDAGFDGGFDASSVAGHDGITSKNVTDRAIEVLEAKGDAPLFLFVHYFDPHFLYQHHEAYDRTSSYAGNLTPGMPMWQLRDIRSRLTRPDLAYLIGLYHEEIAYTDHEIGRLLDRLDELGLAETTLVVLTADHGEEFMEHGWLGHTKNLFDDLVHVPLIVRYPGRISPAVVQRPVSSLDITPTILELVLGHRIAQDPTRPFEGLSLRRTLLAGEEPPARPIYAEVSFDAPTGDAERVAEKRAFLSCVVRGNHKLIHDRERDTFALYRLDRDPAEQRDIWPKHPAVAEELEALLRAFEATHTPDPDSHGNGASEEELERLRALGYLR